MVDCDVHRVFQEGYSSLVVLFGIKKLTIQHLRSTQRLLDVFFAPTRSVTAK